MTRNYSTVKSKVFEIEQLRLFRDKTLALSSDELLSFVLQNFEETPLFSENSQQIIGAVSQEFMSKLKDVIDYEIGERMKEIDVVPDAEARGPRFVSPGIYSKE
jgi:hypothetical protein